MTLAEILDRVRGVAADVVAPGAEGWNERGEWPAEAMSALQAEGVAGLVVPTEHGGLGQGLLTLTRVCETLSVEDASTALCFGMHSVGAACIAAKASEHQARNFLRPISEGRHITTLALSEPGTGSHFYLPETRLEAADDGAYRISGTKAFVTNGGHADSYVVSAVALEQEVDVGQFSMLLVEAEAEGMTWGAPWTGIGMRSNSSRVVELADVDVPSTHLLGEGGDQIWYAFNVVAPYFLVAMTGTYLGVAQAAVRESFEHLRTRVHSHTGRSLSAEPVIQHRVGRVWAELERTRRFAYWAAREGDEGGPQALPALCSTKAEVGHAVVNIVNECMTLVGGQSYQEGSLMDRLLRDARAAHVMSPTTDMLYVWAGRALLDIPLLGD